jgi:hypothetical protein
MLPETVRYVALYAPPPSLPAKVAVSVVVSGSLINPCEGTIVNVTLSRGAAERLVARPATAIRDRAFECFISTYS